MRVSHLSMGFWLMHSWSYEREHMISVSERFEKQSYFKRFINFFVILLLGEIVQVIFRQDVYFGNPNETKWLFLRDAIALIIFSLLGARIRRTQNK